MGEEVFLNWMCSALADQIPQVVDGIFNVIEEDLLDLLPPDDARAIVKELRTLKRRRAPASDLYNRMLGVFKDHNITALVRS